MGTTGSLPEVTRAFSGQRMGGPVRWEEEGTLWLWAWPELLGWPRPISWLFSPVTGHNPPGDLWGVDSAGHLVAIETKRAKEESGIDPFEDFLERDGSAIETPSLAELREKWQDRLAAERGFIESDLEELMADDWTPGTARGVVPYSSKRHVVQWWRELYHAEIAPRFDSEEYERQARCRLQRRTENPAATTHFVGLHTVVPGGTPVFSRQGHTHWKYLAAAVGEERVHVRAVEAKARGEKTHFRSWTPPM